MAILRFPKAGCPASLRGRLNSGVFSNPYGSFYPSASYAFDFKASTYRTPSGVFRSLMSLPGISFSRGSVGYADTEWGTLQSFGSGVPRVTGKGLLMEPQRTNYLLQSSGFNTSPWTAGGASASSGATTAPDGTSTAWKLVEATGNTQHYVQQAFTGIPGASADRNLVVYAKAAERSLLILYMSAGAQAWFNLANGTISNISGTGASATITPMANGWYRCMVTKAAGTNTGETISIHSATTAGSFTYNGDGASGLYIWGAQFEVGLGSTSYIPTTTAVATRSADVCRVTSVSLPSPFTFAAMAQPTTRRSTSRTLAMLTDATSGHSVAFVQLPDTDNRLGFSVTNSAGSLSRFPTTPAATDRQRLAFSVSGTTDLLSLQGATATALSGSLSTLTAIQLGVANDNGAQYGDYLETVLVFPTAYDQTSLNALTT